MKALDCVEVFSVASASVDPATWFVPLLGAVFVLLGVALIRTNVFSDFQDHYPWFGPAFFAFSLLWTVGGSAVLLWSNYTVRQALRTGDVTTVEGVVRNFSPMPPGGHANETFVVDGTRFSYSGYTLGSGFHQTRSEGGPIIDGAYVRISHRDGTILRLAMCTRVR
ncbi:MAG: hypothetical protein M3P06_06710 [Acidobacteriota bacterium]|nr:hypothetical protein [Acidobacteriota bacterium]